MTTPRYSRAMIEHLRFMRTVNGGARTRTMRPTHPENLRTHEALVRRGAVREDAEGFTELTEEGERAIRAAR